MNLTGLVPTPRSPDYSYRHPTYAAEQVAWHAWNGRSRTSCLPALTETTPDGQRRSRTVLLRDAERRIRLGYLSEQFEWRLLGPAQEDWTERAVSWQWLVED